MDTDQVFHYYSVVLVSYFDVINGTSGHVNLRMHPGNIYFYFLSKLPGRNYVFFKIRACKRSSQTSFQHPTCR